MALRFTRKSILITVAILLVVGGAAAYTLWIRQDSDKPGSDTPATDKETELRTEESQAQPGVQVITEESQKTPPSTSSANLEAPSGSFVSNHKASLSSSNYMNSICRTTAGATCEIRFTKGSEIKVLGPNTVGDSGFVSWNWKLQD